MIVMLLFGVLGMGITASAGSLAWYGQHGQHDGELRQCAAAFGAPVNFVNAGAW